MRDESDARVFPAFDRKFFASDEDFTVIGNGALGGKALGLASIKRIISGACPGGEIGGVAVSIPRLTVLATDVFEQFMQQNDLYAIALSGEADERIAHAFMKAAFPAVWVGDLRALVSEVRTPLAVRSSSLLEDALQHPFAGVYATKMIPNNQSSVDGRFKKLVEAIKFVWASTFFRDAQTYMRRIGRPPEEERMGVVIQEVVGQGFGSRYYPLVSGVVRTHNYYPTGPARPEDGVVNLALGLGKTIVDGGITWTYSPRFPNHRPPFGSVRELLKNTQVRFWAVNMAGVAFDPINEDEYLVECGLDEAEWDDVLRFTASTYDAASDRLTLGTGVEGPRVLTFGRILELRDIALNDVVETLGSACKEALGCDVEIEFAMTYDRRTGRSARFGFLQVRPMMVAGEEVTLDESDLTSERAVVASDRVLGNGENQSLRDIVYVKPEGFEARYTKRIAAELEGLNQALLNEDRAYLLIGFGRWGSSDPWLGIPVAWPQISNARVIVEATLPEMHVDASQGSHFFHNMLSFEVLYFTVRHTGRYRIDWDWLGGQDVVSETSFLRHVRVAEPLHIRVDGRQGRGVVWRA